MTLGGGLSRIASNDVKYVFGAPHFDHKNKMASHAYRPGEYFRRYQAEAIANGHQSDENNVEDCNVSADVPITDHASAPAISSTPSTSRRPNNNSQKTAKRKAKPTSDLVAPKKPKKFALSPEVAEVLLKYVKEFKTQCEYKAIDFEADLASLYTEVRRCMAIDFPEGFGPESVSEPGKDIKDMDASEYEEYRKELEAQKAKIRSGYQRIKEKIKSVRQDYRNAVNKGTRSGSGKIVQDNYDLLTDIWGGSPSTTSLSFGIDGDTISLNSGDEQEDQPEISEGKNDQMQQKQISIMNVLILCLQV